MTSPPSTPNDGDQVVKASSGRRRSSGVITLLGVSPEAEHMLALNDIKPERILFMALSLAVILGAGYTFPFILGSGGVDSITFSENHNKIWVLVYNAFSYPVWYGGALLFLKHALPTKVHIFCREILLVSAIGGLDLLLRVTTNKFFLASSITSGYSLFLHCYFGPSTTTPTYAKHLLPVMYLLPALAHLTMGLGRMTLQEQLYELGGLIFDLAMLYSIFVVSYLLARDKPLDKEQNENNPLIRQNAHYVVLLFYFISSAGTIIMMSLLATHEFGAVAQSVALQVLSIFYLECAQAFSLRASDTTRFAR